MSSQTAAADVVGIGQNATDTLIELPRFPEFNSEMPFRSAHVLPGGQVATAVIACQQWGLKTRYIGKVGDDAAGELQRRELVRAGVESHLIVVPDCASQSAYILVDERTGERTILYNRDERLGLTPQDLREDWVRSARLVHVDGHNAVPGAVAGKWARESGAVVTADLDHVYPGIDELLQVVDYPVTSRSFPEQWTGEADLFQAIRKIHQRYQNRMVCATLGQDGAVAWDGLRFWYAPAYRVPAVDTTGAGDVFHGAFAYGMLQGWPMDRLLEFCSAAAGLNCTALGARGGIKSIDEIEDLRRKGEKYPEMFHVKYLK
jgi:sugar/nucleoside kinase (ribokinase family)